MNSFHFISLPPRNAKPRQQGLTMMLDKHLGINATQDWVSSFSDYVDIVKFGWGTSRLLPEAVLKEKIAILRAAQIRVCPGGTFLEIAYLQNKVEAFLETAKNLGFDGIEVSDGSIDMPHEEKLRLIETAREAGFCVSSEIGKKSESADRLISVVERVEQVRSELAAGSSHVIIEAREAGSVGIFDHDGEVMPEMVKDLVNQLGGIHNILFEAPLKSQQVWLIQHLGNEVNLGNIAPEEVLSLETLRLGLRADTLNYYHSATEDTC